MLKAMSLSELQHNILWICKVEDKTDFDRADGKAFEPNQAHLPQIIAKHIKVMQEMMMGFC